MENNLNIIEQLTVLRRALDHYKVVAHFQPIINNKTQKIEHYESLVRLIDEQDNILSPKDFLEVSKRGQYYTELNQVVLENSFWALKKTTSSITINLSIQGIGDKSTREKFITLLEENKQYAHRVVLELLECEEIGDLDVVKTFMDTIRTFGVRVAIDDFGTGYSNFNRVLAYEPDFIKIDGSLIQNIKVSNLAYFMVEAIVSFSKKAKIKTIAEHVESDEVYQVLKALGVDYSQGFYFGKAKALD